MLTIMRPVTEWVEEEMSFEEFEEYVQQARLFPAIKPTYSWQALNLVDEITLYKTSGPHHVCGFVDIPCSEFPEKPEGVCWDDHAMANLEVAYKHLVDKGVAL